MLLKILTTSKLLLQDVCTLLSQCKFHSHLDNLFLVDVLGCLVPEILPLFKKFLAAAAVFLFIEV